MRLVGVFYTSQHSTSTTAAAEMQTSLPTLGVSPWAHETAVADWVARYEQLAPSVPIRLADPLEVPMGLPHLQISLAINTERASSLSAKLEESAELLLNRLIGIRTGDVSGDAAVVDS
ncbi:hypothetical protein EGR_11192 [Echinococcus granulosus]|uniref:Uncharacterized protein n=1 Tax=Echinococcus granulosus TaxID=6210 RepID=W6U0K2_ECHGR|nr:hypothetical protein EGR_11192 [Echinococcus granulosus]EUB53951.1 hypothetical protein EGR_11192 [Echinococcus granulosus]